MHPNHHCTVHFRINNCQTVHLRSLSVFFILMIHTDNAHGKFYVYRSLPTRWLCNDFLQKSPKTKSNNTFTKPFITPNFCKWNLWKTRHSKTVNFFTFKVALIWDNMRVKVITTFESRKNHSFNTVHPRQILLWFGGLLEKIIAMPPGWQTSMSIKLTWALSVCITSM